LSEEPPVLVKILLLLDAGNYPAKIARILGFSKQKVRYWVKAAEREGLVKRKSRDVVTLYQLTWKGRETSKKFLDGMERERLRRFVRLHNVVVKYEIVAQPSLVIDWRKVELQNWDQLVGRELGLTVRKNPDSIEIFCDSVEGQDPYELLLLLFDEANRLASHLEEKFRMKLGRPQLSRKPHFAVLDPVAKHLSDFMEFSDDIGKLDESEGEGELDLYDPNFVKNYLISFTTLPALVSKMGAEISEVKAVLLAFTENFKLLSTFDETLKLLDREIKEHLALIQEYRKEARERADDSSNLIREVRGSLDALNGGLEGLRGAIETLRRRRSAKRRKKPDRKLIRFKSFLAKLIR